MGQHPVHGAGSLGEGSPVSDTQAPRSGPPIVRPRTQPLPRRPDWPTMLWRSCGSGVQVRQGTACWVTALPCSLQLAPWAKENAPAALPSCGLPRMGPAQGGPGLSTSPGPPSRPCLQSPAQARVQRQVCPGNSNFTKKPSLEWALRGHSESKACFIALLSPCTARAPSPLKPLVSD